MTNFAPYFSMSFLNKEDDVVIRLLLRVVVDSLVSKSKLVIGACRIFSILFCKRLLILINTSLKLTNSAATEFD